MLKVLPYTELEEEHSSALAFLEANQLFELYYTLVCHINSDDAHELCPELKDLESYFVFATDGCLYRLDGTFCGFKLVRITDTRMYERVKAHARALGMEDPMIITILENFEIGIGV